jgi:hypothetical protein
VRPIREELDHRVRALLDELGVPAALAAAGRAVLR